MDVYLIPVCPPGKDEYEMYCEHGGDDQDLVGDEHATGRFRELYQKFKAVLAHAEQQRQSGAPPGTEGARSWSERMKDRGLRWLVEKIAEQRLLWRLRKETEVSLFHPDDISGEQAMKVARADLQHEAERHLKWTIIDGVLFVVTGALFWLPGPNVLAYYFGFRLVGHFLSRRGAMHGLSEVRWKTCATEQLSRLRQAIAMAGHERDHQVHQVASELQLPHLAKFFERTSIPTA
jgi:K+-H+ exchange-related protein